MYQGTKLTGRNQLHFHTLTRSERSEREINKTVPFAITGGRIKYLGVNLTKETK